MSEIKNIEYESEKICNEIIERYNYGEIPEVVILATLRTAGSYLKCRGDYQEAKITKTIYEMLLDRFKEEVEITAKS